MSVYFRAVLKINLMSAVSDALLLSFLQKERLSLHLQNFRHSFVCAV